VKRTLTISVLLLVFGGCATSYSYDPSTDINYKNLPYPHKAMATQVNSYGEKKGGYVLAGGKTIEEAEELALKACKPAYGGYDCILVMSDGRYVFNINSSIYRYEQAKEQKERNASIQKALKDGKYKINQTMKLSSYFDKLSYKALVSTSKDVRLRYYSGNNSYSRPVTKDYFFAKGNQTKLEFAIVGAFYVCEKEHSIEICELDRLGDFEANETEKKYWKEWYVANKDSYQFGYKFNKFIKFSGLYYYGSEELLVRYSDKPYKLKKRKPKITI